MSVDALTQGARQAFESYAEPEERPPLGTYAGLLFAPRATRVVASTLAALTRSDFLQIAYKAAESGGLAGS